MSKVLTKVFNSLTVNDGLKEFTKWLDQNKQIEMMIYSKDATKFKQINIRVLYKEIT